jgi:uncharacterized protein YeaO (DUF488 family)
MSQTYNCEKCGSQLSVSTATGKNKPENKGKQYVTCSPCKFFKWVNEIVPTVNLTHTFEFTTFDKNTSFTKKYSYVTSHTKEEVEKIVEELQHQHGNLNLISSTSHSLEEKKQQEENENIKIVVPNDEE